MKTKDEIQKLIEQKQQELDKLKNELESIKDLKKGWGKEYNEEQGKLFKAEVWKVWIENDKDARLLEKQFDLMREFQTFAKLRNGDWVADWGNENQDKEGLCLYDKKVRTETYALNNTFVYGISFQSEEIAKEALEIFGERIEQFYGK